ncbi:MAG: hypothetical protein M1274_00485 [Actinobacteria bacterium]|nr:hypothetical protein [Actinomycetota bacterium]
MLGVGIIAQWSLSFFSHNIPELATEPTRIWFHITAEMVTAILLIVSAIALLTDQGWSRHAYLVGMGMLFYTSIVSPGYFAQRGQRIWLVFFTAVIVLGVASVVVVL